MKRNSPAVIVVVLLILGVVISLDLQRSPNGSALGSSPGIRLSTSSSEKATVPFRYPGIANDHSPDDSKSTASRLHKALADLHSEETTQADARKILVDLRRYLASAPPSTAAEEMVSFLGDESLDAETGLGFGIGPNGFLDHHPSLRVALLDWLGQIDLKSAGLAAERVLSSPTNADEWCVSLRNFARSRPTSDSFAFLRTKTEELIRNPEWQTSPTTGYLEAFDVLVYSGATQSTGLLAELVSDRSPGNRAVAHASFVTLDRLVLQEPAEMFRQFAALPELSKARGPMVANMLARADLRDDEQKSLVREYLLHPDRCQQELEGFAEAYPNANHTLSLNLLTGKKTPNHGDLIAHDRAVLQVIEEWCAEPAFRQILPDLETMRSRLATFVSQAGK